DVALRTNGRILKHGGANAVPGEMPEREAMLGEFFCYGAMHMAGHFTRTHEAPCRFQRFRVGIRHRLGTRTDFPANERPRKLHPITARTGDFQRIKKKVIGGDDAISWNFE